MKDCVFESRHLGLVTAEETHNLQQKLDALAVQAEQTIDLAALAALAQSAPPLVFKPLEAALSLDAPIIAVARDAAFCFYYEESLALLQEMGARLISFSPLEDESLPMGCCGLCSAAVIRSICKRLQKIVPCAPLYAARSSAGDAADCRMRRLSVSAQDA